MLSKIWRLTSPMISMVLHGERTTKLRNLGPLEALLPMNHFKKGSMIPAISSMEVNVFSNIKAETWQIQNKLLMIKTLRKPWISENSTHLPLNSHFVCCKDKNFRTFQFVTKWNSIKPMFAYWTWWNLTRPIDLIWPCLFCFWDILKSSLAIIL